MRSVTGYSEYSEALMKLYIGRHHTDYKAAIENFLDG